MPCSRMFLHLLDFLPTGGILGPNRVAALLPLGVVAWWQLLPRHRARAGTLLPGKQVVRQWIG